MEFGLHVPSIASAQVLVDDPEKAEAYYLRAVCQVRLLGLVDDPPKYEEVESGLRKYLEVAPSGPHVAEVKKMIESIAMAKATG